MDRFAYFTIRLQIPARPETDHLAGILEDLGTGAKRPFESAEELVRLVRAGGAGHAPAGDSIMPPETRPGNTGDGSAGHP
jgi:hypothetical protein